MLRILPVLRSPWLRVALVLFAVLLPLYGAAVASAHAELVRSDPGAGQVLASPPSLIRLWYSETLEEQFLAVTITGPAGTRVDQGKEPRLTGPDRRLVEMDAPPLGQGTHTVRWRVVSSSDSHVITGLFKFHIGAPSETGVLDSVSDAPASPFTVGLRWLSTLSLLLLAGGFLFRQLVFLPGIKQLPDPVRTTYRAYGDARTITAIRYATIAFLVVSVVQLFDQAAQVAGVGFLQAMEGEILSRLVVSTRYGVVWLLRMMLVVALMGVLEQIMTYARDDHATPHNVGRWWWAGAVLCIALLFASAAVGHGASRDPVAVGLTANWLHLVAVAAWIGGLFHLILLLWKDPPQALGVDRRAAATALLAPFSKMAVISLQVLLVTGWASAWINLIRFESFLDTAYGRLLLLKLALGLPLFGLGAWHFLRSLAAARTLRVEAIVAAALVMVGGAMASTPPASIALAGGQTPPSAGVPTAVGGVTVAQGAQETLVVLQITPAQLGQNTLRVTLKDNLGAPVQNARVQGALRPDDGAPEVPVVLGPEGETYTTVVQVYRPGPWAIRLEVQRPGKPAEQVTFQVPLPLPGAQQILTLAGIRMGELQSLKERQELRGGPQGGTIHTEFAYASPNAMWLQTDDGAENIIIEHTRYLKAVGADWITLELPEEAGVTYPEFAYIDQTATNIALLGRETVNGVDSYVVSYAMPRLDAYFQAWIGTDDYLVHQLTMMGPSHFMTSYYYDFNVPNDIRPPR